VIAGKHFNGFKFALMKNKIQFLGNKDSNWGDFSAQDPVDQISLSLDDSPDLLINFVKKHAGSFITGFISYEYGARQLGAPVHDIGELPAVHFCAYSSYNTVPIHYPSSISTWDEFKPIILRAEYDKHFQKIQNHIQAGDFYQINYTHPLKSKTDATPEDLFQTLRQQNQVRYSVFMEAKDWAIHSLSPEQFIKIENGIVRTKPIKGTLPRGESINEDEHNLNTLLNSEKEQAELYMIIDLLRNDLGKICESGSVKVLEAKSIQKLEKIFHTYGVVQGELKKGLLPIEALLSMSPGGSISGCPKKRACEIIHDIEPYPRGIYTGTIGYILPNGTLNFNIAIRTIIQQGNDLTLGVGGGITIDSKIEDEYNETLAKAASFQPW
jgi:anthranilate/para-aminobenzoate synthase component I